jgi:hypothetical protein
MIPISSFGSATTFPQNPTLVHACITKRGLSKRNVLHELYHHVVENKNSDISERKEESEANRFVIQVMMREF